MILRCRAIQTTMDATRIRQRWDTYGVRWIYVLELELKNWQDSHADRLSNRRHEGQKNEKKQQWQNETRDRVKGDEVMQEKLPHTRDPEFATPESQEKRRQRRTEKKRRDNTNRSKLSRTSALMKRRMAEWDAEQGKLDHTCSIPPRSHRSCSPFHAAPAFGSFSWCISGPPASVLPPHLHSVHSEPFYHGWAAQARHKSYSSEETERWSGSEQSLCFPTWSMKVSCLWIVLSYCSFCCWNFLLSSLSFSFSCLNVSSFCWAWRA